MPRLLLHLCILLLSSPSVLLFGGEYRVKWSHSYEGNPEPFTKPPHLLMRTNDGTLVVSGPRLIGLDAGKGETRWSQPGVRGIVAGIDPGGRLVVVNLSAEDHDLPKNWVCRGSRCYRLDIDRHQLDDWFLIERHHEYLDPLMAGEPDRYIYGTKIGNSGNIHIFTGAEMSMDWVYEFDRQSKPTRSYGATGMERSGYLVEVAEDLAGTPFVLTKYYNYKTPQPDGRAWPWTHLTSGLASGYELPYGTTEDFVPQAIATDVDGAILIAGGGGSSRRQGPTYFGGPFKIVKYSKDRSLAWINRYIPPDSFGGVAFAVRTDQAGSVFVTGNCDLDEKPRDEDGLLHTAFVTIKYSKEGSPVWTNTLSSSSHAAGEPSVLIVGPAGDVVVAGTSFKSKHDYQYILLRYATDGRLLWEKRFPKDSSDQKNADVRFDPKKLAWDSGGNLYYSSLRYDLEIGGNVAEVSKFSPTGELEWQRTFSGTRSAGLADQMVSGDSATNSHISGYEAGVRGNWLTVKYSPEGQALWTNRSDLMLDTRGFMAGMASSDFGSMFLLGVKLATPSAPDAGFVLRKMSSEGDEVWHYISAPNHRPLSLSVDEAEGIHVGCLTTTPDGVEGFEVLKFRADGLLLWTTQIPTTLSDSNRVRLSSIQLLGRADSTLLGSAVTEYSPDGPPPPATGVIFRMDEGGYITETNRFESPPSALLRGQNSTCYLSLRTAGLIRDRWELTTIKFGPDSLPIWTNRFEKNIQVALSEPSDPTLIQDSRGGVIVVTDAAERRALLESNAFHIHDYRRVPPVGWIHSLGEVFTTMPDPQSRTGKWMAALMRDVPRLTRQPGSVGIDILLAPSATSRVERGETLNGPWQNVGIVETDVVGDGRFVDPTPPLGTTFYRFTGTTK